jgi:hypothetical protein
MQSAKKIQTRNKLIKSLNTLKRKFMRKCIQQMSSFANNQKEKKVIKAISNKFREIKLFKSAFRKLAAYSAKNYTQRQIIRVLRKRQVKLLLPAYMLQWHKRC